MMRRLAWLLIIGWVLSSSAIVQAAEGDPLPGTEPLTLEGDLASYLVDGVDRFLRGQIELAAEQRESYWQRDVSSPEAYEASVTPQRERLAHILGVRDPRPSQAALELVATTTQPALVGRGENFEVLAVRWRAFGEVYGQGLLLQPTGEKPIAQVIAIPDADVTPEQLAGLVEGVPAQAQYARRLAESGCRVLVPLLIDRHIEARRGRAQLTNREFVYRAAYELGRHLIGYEVQQVLAGVDCFEQEGPSDKPVPVGVIGWGEGGLIALAAAALDPRIDACCVSGYFDRRAEVWRQPIDHNVFGLLEQFGDAQLASLVAPRTLVIEAARGPELELPGNGGAPATLASPQLENVKAEFALLGELVDGVSEQPTSHLVLSGDDGQGSPGTDVALANFLKGLVGRVRLATPGNTPEHLRKDWDPAPRQQAHLEQLDRHSQALLAVSGFVRKEFMNRLDTSSLEAYERTSAEYRDIFYRDVVGKFEIEPLPFNPRTRQAYETDKYVGYEVVLDVFPDVIAYGLLFLPKGMQPDERRPVVVCQHGLEGRPQDVIGEPGYQYYKAFATQLCERGFITFAPQNLYIFTDRFRTLQRQANPIKKTLFSVIVPQHQQIVDWLQTLPMVDAERIGFYGLSYGGKTAMRVPALVTDYALSICSADFNEWVLKNASTAENFSYMWAGEYEIFEFDLGSTFNYAEMAALICPRPFMVERGHFDGVGEDHWVGFEYAKVLNLYAARLNLGDRTEIEWFVGPHTINGQGTYRFLHKHLAWPEPAP